MTRYGLLALTRGRLTGKRWTPPRWYLCGRVHRKDTPTFGEWEKLNYSHVAERGLYHLGYEGDDDLEHLVPSASYRSELYVRGRIAGGLCPVLQVPLGDERRVVSD